MKEIKKITLNELKNIIKYVIKEEKNNKFSNLIKYELNDFYYLKDEVNLLLTTIHKYFKFDYISGSFSNEEGINAKLDNGIKLISDLSKASIKIILGNGNIYYVEFIGDLTDNKMSLKRLEEEIQNIYNQENYISLVIGENAYAVKSISFDKKYLENYKIYIVEGVQIEGKKIGETEFGESSYAEKFIK
jgi:hypothetical protein